MAPITEQDPLGTKPPDGPPKTEPRVEDVRPPADDPGRTAIDAVARSGKRAAKADQRDALEWFLSDEDSADVATQTFELNVSSNPDEPKWIRWTVEAISREQIRQIRKMSQPARSRAAGGGEIDDMAANLGIAAAGTRSPDLEHIAKTVNAPSATEALRQRLKHKPGLIDQIASSVLTVSGYDDADVRDIEAVRG